MDKQLAFVADVTPSNVDVVLRLRIIRLWKTPSYMNPLKPNTIEMVLIDEKDDKIQAYVKKDHVDQFLSILEEGLTITLSDFMVGENAGTFLFAPSKWRLNFQPETTVKMIDNFIGSLHGFNFVPFDAILNNTLADFQICDVIGYITHVGKIIPGTRGVGKPNKRRILRLENLEGQTIDCTIWDGYVDEFNSFIARESGVKHVVIIVQFGKIKKYNKCCTFGTALFASKLFINSNIAEINDFKHSLKGNVGGDSGKLKVAEISTQTYFEGPESFYANCVQLTLDEIPRITKETQCAVVATIHEVCKDKPWFYIACSKCKFKVEPNTQTQGGNLWKCPTHGDEVTDVYPRYKVYARVVDHTGSATFILFDRDVEKLITMTAYNMRGNVAEYGDDYPEELDDMAGQRAIFSFKVSRWNLREKKMGYYDH